MQRLVGDLALARGRVHEFCGPARRTLAAMLMGECSGTVIWIGAAWIPERLYAPGLCEFAEPSRIIFAMARRPEDLMWSAEECLRSGAAPLVIADLPGIPSLTPVRRLHLAAETGADAAQGRRPPPLGIVLTPGEGGAQGIESRWRLDPAPSIGPNLALEGGVPGWRLQRLRARTDPVAAWTMYRPRYGQPSLTPCPV